MIAIAILLNSNQKAALKMAAINYTTNPEMCYGQVDASGNCNKGTKTCYYIQNNECFKEQVQAFISCSPPDEFITLAECQSKLTQASSKAYVPPEQTGSAVFKGVLAILLIGLIILPMSILKKFKWGKK